MKKHHSKRPYNKVAIKEALMKIAAPKGFSHVPSPASRICSAWKAWKDCDEWIRLNPEKAKEVAFWDDEGTGQTVIEEHHEKFELLNEETCSFLLISLLREDSSIFREMATELARQKKQRAKKKPFPWKDWLLLKNALAGQENVYQTAKDLKNKGLIPKSESFETTIADLRRRRRKHKLPALKTNR